jgi:transcriptional regulator with XRE-family HTH domain
MRPSVRRHVLVDIRKEIGYQQKELAALVGCSTSAIKRIELGSLALSRRLARKMSESLGVGMAYLLENNLRKNPVTDSGESWTRAMFERLPRKEWKNLDAYERVWKLLYCSMLISGYQEYRGMIGTLPNPLEAAWKLAEKLEEAYTAFLREYRPAFAALERRAKELGKKKVSLKHRDYPYASLESVIDDVREMQEAERSARSAGYSREEELSRYLLTTGLEDRKPNRVREYVEKLGDRLNPKERKLFIELCGPEDETAPIVIELPGRTYSPFE